MFGKSFLKEVAAKWNVIFLLGHHGTLCLHCIQHSFKHLFHKSLKKPG